MSVVRNLIDQLQALGIAIGPSRRATMEAAGILAALKGPVGT